MANLSPNLPAALVAEVPTGIAPLLTHLPHDAEQWQGDIWHHLQEVISATSGFQNWQIQQRLTSAADTDSLSEQVRSYLRETLETLAY